MHNPNQNIFNQAINALLTLQSLIDTYTPTHESHVAVLAARIAKELNLTPVQIETTRLAGLVHDIGKVAIPLEILNKPSKLTPEEFAIIQTHPQLGYDILKKIHFPLPIANVMYAHHEYLDGTGYPRGLTAEAIPIETRIVTVSDIVQSMVEDRPYRKGLSIQIAIDEITRLSGTRLDPKVVDACIRVLALYPKIADTPDNKD